MNGDPQWMLLCGFLVMLMQAGFTGLESGLVRAKNSINVAIKNVLDFCVSFLMFALIGYGLMFGMSAGGWVGTSGFLLDGLAPEALAFFFFQAMFCGTATTIVSGAVAERMRFVTYGFVALVISTVIYPIVGHWAWARDAAGAPAGWLAQLGFIDFAGSTVVHSVGGWVALCALIMVGPRLGRFGKRPRRIEGNSLPMATLGTFLLWFGWFGFNGGSTLTMTAAVPGILVNTGLGGAVGGLAGLLWGARKRGNPTAESVLNGVLAGLVAVTASCDLVSPAAAVVIAAIGAIIAALVDDLLIRLRIDDAISAVPVHLGAGVWGTLAVALFAPGSALGESGRLGLFAVQLLGIFAIGAFCCLLSLGSLLLYRRFQTLRVSPRDELIGLNIAEHGATTSLLDLLGQMDVQAHTGDFSRPVSVEVESEASQVAAFYNAVLEKFNLEIDRRKMAMQRLADIANHDALTGLGNRRYLFERLRRILGMASPEHPGALLYLDLDGFKRVNDRIGHDAGDFLLKQVARWLRQTAGQEALIARLGGDEFAIVLTDLAHARNQSTAIARVIIETLSQVVDYGEHRLHIGVSIGIALFGDDPEESVKDLIRRADEAMYAAKLAGKGTLHMHGVAEEA